MTEVSRAMRVSREIPFVKAHACGNDFLIVEESDADQNHRELARRLCKRNTSVGADGIEFLHRRADGSYFLRLINADGSEAELSGNGTRCVAAWLAYSEQVREVVLHTHGGPRACSVVRADGTRFEIESEMGVPRAVERTIELPTMGAVIGVEVNIGNPHFVVFVDDDRFEADGRSWQHVGEAICTSPLFPNGTNVEFVHRVSKNKIEIRIYERGVGPTSSSGTGTCASATAAIAMHGAARQLTVDAPGGSQQVVWPADNAVMQLTGPAEIICWGGRAAL